MVENRVSREYNIIVSICNVASISQGIWVKELDVFKI